jgi:hypothetical protein
MEDLLQRGGIKRKALQRNHYAEGGEEIWISKAASADY